MLYLRICFDKTDGSALRDELRKQHREYIGSHVARARNGVKVVQGGPMCPGDDISRNLGSFLVVEADSLESAMRFHNEDPFTRAELFDRASVVRWDRHIGNDGQIEYAP